MSSLKGNKIPIMKHYIGLPKEIYILLMAKIINSLGRFIGPLLTLILTTKIGMSQTAAGSLMTLSMILQSPCVLIGGKLADTIGRKRVICIFFGLSALTYLLCAFMPVSTYMAYTLILASCFASFSGSAYDAMVTDYTTPENRQDAFSLIYMGMNIGAVIAPVIGGFLLENHLKLLFAIDAVTTFAAIFLVGVFTKEHERVVKMVEKREEKDSEVNKNVIHVLLETPVLLEFAFIMSIYSFVYMQYGFGMPLGMNQVFGNRGAALFGIICSINALLVIFFTPLAINITRKMKIKNVLAFGGICYGACFVVMAFSHHMTGFVVGIVLLTVGEILCTVNTAAFIANLAKVTHLGRINSVLTIIREAGGCLSPIVIGWVLKVVTIQQSFVVVAVIAVAGGVLMAGLREE